MSDFFTELEEDIREERLLVLWRKYGNYIIGLALAIVIGTVGSVLWQHLKNKSRLQVQHSFSMAVGLMKAGKKEEALKAFQVLSQEGGGYGKLAQLYEAALLLDPEAIYNQIAQENMRDPALGNLPKILMGGRALDKSNVLKALESLAAPNNAWAPLSLELLALADLNKGNEMKAIERYLRILKEPYTTFEEQVRAGMMLSQFDIPPNLLKKEE